MVVHEDWDHAKKQSVYEEEELSIGEEDVISSEDLAGSNGTMLADNNIITDEYLGSESEAVVADAPLQGEMMVANETDQPQVNTESSCVWHSHIPDISHLFIETSWRCTKTRRF